MIVTSYLKTDWFPKPRFQSKSNSIFFVFFLISPSKRERECVFEKTRKRLSIGNSKSFGRPTPAHIKEEIVPLKSCSELTGILEVFLEL